MERARLSAAFCLLVVLCSSCIHVRTASAVLSPTHLYGSGGTTVERYMQLLTAYLNPKYHLLIIYDAIGSGLGRTQFITNVAQYAETDVPLSEAEESKLRGTVKYHLPLALQTISVFTYIPGNPVLYLNAHVLARIFQGAITTWDHPEIKGLNPHFAVHKGQRIYAVHRKDVSGTTQLFTRWLQVAQPSLWKLGSAGTVSWPRSFISASGSDGVAAAMRSTPYSIGYIGSSVGRFLGLNEAHINNRAGSFLSSAQADVYAAVPRTLPRASAAWSGVTLINARGRLTWPISSFAYLLARQNNVRVGARGGVLRSVLNYIMGAAGQRLAASNDFVQLPSKVAAQNKAAIATLILAKGVKVPF